MTQPSLRIGDEERQAARTALDEHLRAGRLDPDEYADRYTQATTARFAADLDPLFVDLPAPHAGDTPSGSLRRGRNATSPHTFAGAGAGAGVEAGSGSGPAWPAWSAFGSSGRERRLLRMLVMIAAVASIVGWGAWWVLWFVVPMAIFGPFGGVGCGRSGHAPRGGMSGQ